MFVRLTFNLTKHFLILSEDEFGFYKSFGSMMAQYSFYKLRKIYAKQILNQIICSPKSL